MSVNVVMDEVEVCCVGFKEDVLPKLRERLPEKGGGAAR